AHGEAPRIQLLGQILDAAAHPSLFTIGATRHLITEQLLHRRHDRGVLRLRLRPTPDHLARLLERPALEEESKMLAAVHDRSLAEAGNRRDSGDPPEAEATGLDGSEQPALLVVQGAQERDQLPVVPPVWVVDPLQASRAVASIGTRATHLTLLHHDPG